MFLKCQISVTKYNPVWTLPALCQEIDDSSKTISEYILWVAGLKCIIVATAELGLGGNL